jgi:uncharacterized protein (DUF934 family)
MSGERATVIVTDRGFAAPDPTESFVPVAEVAEGTEPLRIDLAADADPAAIAPHFARIVVIRIPFRSFADGRGLTLARELRRLGFRGRIRAAGHLIPDQWPLSRACGIDEAEIAALQAARQPAPAWQARKGRIGYLDLLR